MTGGPAPPRVVVLGGGSAGWITACLLHKELVARGVRQAIVLEDDTVVDWAYLEPLARTDLHAGPDRDKRANSSALPDDGGRVNHGHRMDARRNLWAGVHHHRQSSHRQTPTRRKDRRLQPQRLPIGAGP